MRNKPKSAKELRKFGIVVSIPLAIIGLVLLWREKNSSYYFLGVSAYLFLSAALLPTSLSLVERGWMAFARVLSAIMTRIILVLAYVLVITPFGLFLRLIGKDLLQTKIDKGRVSYWVPVEKNGPQTRPHHPF
ncbi:MAG: hypothetical protein BMS9Abin05_2474 [Rhodothermia bacterium]|nr:MAG: hypothetical protein BMS9Abin05_2474 [Rhodothermia bacterium]